MLGNSKVGTRILCTVAISPVLMAVLVASGTSTLTKTDDTTKRIKAVTIPQIGKLATRADASKNQVSRRRSRPPPKPTSRLTPRRHESVEAKKNGYYQSFILI
jgi:hypothetical protein